MRFTKPLIITLACAAIGAGITSCDTTDEKDVVVSFKSFPQEQRLNGTVQTIDRNEPCVPGKVVATDNGYLVFMYESEYFLSVTDLNFKEVARVAHKGNGPGEVTGVGTFGQKLNEDGLYSVFDHNAFVLYGYNPESNAPLKEITHFPNEFKAYAPWKLVQLKNGSYMAPRGDFKYGTILYDPAAGTTTELPIGLTGIDEQNPITAAVSKHILNYSRKNGIIAELYGSTPVIILRDETGAIVRTITFDDLIAQKDEYGNPTDIFNDVILTDDYIWLLYGDYELSKDAHVLVMSYKGEPKANYVIPFTSGISLDVKRKLIISVDPNNEEAPIVTYKVDKL